MGTTSHCEQGIRSAKRTLDGLAQREHPAAADEDAVGFEILNHHSAPHAL